MYISVVVKRLWNIDLKELRNLDLKIPTDSHTRRQPKWQYWSFKQKSSPEDSSEKGSFDTSLEMGKPGIQIRQSR